MLIEISLEKTMKLKKILGSMGLGRTITAVFRNSENKREAGEKNG